MEHSQDLFMILTTFAGKLFFTPSP